MFNEEKDAELVPGHAPLAFVPAKPSLADVLKESVSQMQAIERGEAPPLPVRYPSPDFDPAESEFVFETDDDALDEACAELDRIPAYLEATTGRAVLTADDLEAATYILKTIWDVRARYGTPAALAVAEDWAREPDDGLVPEQVPHPTLETVERGRELMDRLERVHNPFVLTKMGRIQDLTDEDLEGFAFETDDDEEPEWMASARAAEEDGMSAEEITAWYVAQEKANPTTLWSVIRGYAFAPGMTVRGRIWLIHHIWKNARALRRMEGKP